MVGAPQTAHAQAPHKTQNAAVGAERAAETVYLALLAEMQLQSGQAGPAYSLMLEAARKSTDPDVYRRAIQIALQNRAADAALDAAHAWARAHPQSTEALRVLLQLQLSLQQLTASGDVLSNLLAVTPAKDRADLWAAIAQSYAKVQDHAVALAILGKQLRPWLEKMDHAAGAWSVLAQVQWVAGQRSTALSSIRRALSFPPAPEFLGALVADVLQADQPADMESLVLQHLERTPTDAVVRLTYVRHLIGQEHLQAALPHLQTLTAAASASAESWLLQGLVEHQLNRYPAAETSLKQFLSVVDAQPPAQAVSPRGVVQALLMLSQMAELRGDVTQAQAWLDRITDGDDVLRVQARRASLLLKKGQFEEGLALIAAVPERQGSDARAKLLTQVQLLRDHKAWGRAYALLDQENTRQSDDVDLLYEQAMMADKMSRFEDMERLLRRTLAFKPDYHHALNALGYALADRNERLPEAKALIEQALSLAPGDPFITDSLGWVEFRLGHLAQAEHLLRQAFDKRADAEIALHLAEVLWTQGKRDEAKALFRQAHEMQPDHAQLQPTLQRLGVQW